MSLSFAEYLIEQNLLSTDQVVEAMLIQLKSQPSNTEPIYDLRALSNDNFLKVLLNQQNENSDFIEVKNSKSQVKNKKKPAVSAKAAISTQMLKEYVDCFEGSVYPNIHNRLSEIDATNISQENFKSIFKKIEREFITAKAASEFIKAEKSLEVSAFMIKFIQKNINKNSKEDIEKIKNKINSAIIILNNYCIILKNSQNELDINEESKDLLKQLMNNLSERNNYL